MESKIEDDLEEFISRRGDLKKAEKKGIQINKAMLLEASNCDNLYDINMVSEEQMIY